MKKTRSQPEREKQKRNQKQNNTFSPVLFASACGCSGCVFVRRREVCAPAASNCHPAAAEVFPGRKLYPSLLEENNLMGIMIDHLCLVVLVEIYSNHIFWIYKTVACECVPVVGRHHNQWAYCLHTGIGSGDDLKHV